MTLRVVAVHGESRFGNLVITKKGLTIGLEPLPDGYASWEEVVRVLQNSGVVGTRILFISDEEEDEAPCESEEQPVQATKKNKSKGNPMPKPVEPLGAGNLEENMEDARQQQELREADKRAEEEARRKRQEEKAAAKEEHNRKKGRAPKAGGK